MSVFCLLQHNLNNTILQFVFEKSSRAYATKERLEAKISKEQKDLVKFEIKEMHVFQGEEPKHD